MGTLRDTSKHHARGEARRQARGAGADVGRLRAADEAPLYEGLHTLEVTARDTLGQVTKFKKTLGVDTTEKLRPFVPLGLGARGNDVVSLTRRLRVEGFWKGNARSATTRRSRRRSTPTPAPTASRSRAARTR